MRKKLFGLVIAMLATECLTGCDGSNQSHSVTNNSFDSQRLEAVEAAHQGILAMLRDPDSAVFNPQDGAAYSTNEDGSLYAVCGTVNSKNGFGGFTGDEAWIFVISENAVYTQETGVTDAMTLRDCAGGVHKATARSNHRAHSARHMNNIPSEAPQKP